MICVRGEGNYETDMRGRGVGETRLEITIFTPTKSQSPYSTPVRHPLAARSSASTLSSSPLGRKEGRLSAGGRRLAEVASRFPLIQQPQLIREYQHKPYISIEVIATRKRTFVGGCRWAFHTIHQKSAPQTSGGDGVAPRPARQGKKHPVLLCTLRGYSF